MRYRRRSASFWKSEAEKAEPTTRTNRRDSCPFRQSLLCSGMSRNFKPEYAVNQRLKDKQKPMYIGGLKIPTPANSSFQCWCVTVFTFVGYHCYFTNFPINSFAASNCLGLVLCSLTLYSLWMTWSTPAGTIPDKGWVRPIPRYFPPSSSVFRYSLLRFEPNIHGITPHLTYTPSLDIERTKLMILWSSTLMPCFELALLQNRL